MLSDVEIKLINAFKDSTYKNGNYKVPQRERELLDLFLTAGDNEVIDRKVLTKISKVLCKAIPEGLTLVGSPIGDYRIYTSIMTFSEKRVELYFHYDPDELLLLQNAKKAMGIVDKYKSLDTASKTKPTKATLYGDLDVRIIKELEALRDKWRDVIYSRELDSLSKMASDPRTLLIVNDEVYRSRNRDIYMNLQNRRVIGWKKVLNASLIEGYKTCLVVKDKEELEIVASETAKRESDAFYKKMCGKVGGLLSNKQAIEEVKCTGTDMYNSDLSFQFTGGTRFTLFNQIIVNCSSLGNHFYQYPCRFVDVFISNVRLPNPSESSFKAAFKNLTAVES